MAPSVTVYHAVTVAPAGHAIAVSEALDTLAPAPTATGLHDRDDGSGLWEVGAYFEDRPDEAGLALVAAVHGVPAFSVAPVGSRDWLAQVRAGLSPVEAGRFVVYGSHDRGRIPEARVRLEIEAALAFGTGHHASTRGCLRAFDALLRRGVRPRRVADLGTGTGVLAMAAAATGSVRVRAGDVDPVAVSTARINVAANGHGARVRVCEAAGFRHPLLERGRPYDLVFANILAGPLRRLAGPVASHLAPGGRVILAGLLERQAPAVRAAYFGWGLRLVDRYHEDGWATLILRRGSAGAGGDGRSRGVRSG